MSGAATALFVVTALFAIVGAVFTVVAVAIKFVLGERP